MLLCLCGTYHSYDGFQLFFFFKVCGPLQKLSSECLVSYIVTLSLLTMGLLFVVAVCDALASISKNPRDIHTVS